MFFLEELGEGFGFSVTAKLLMYEKEEVAEFEELMKNEGFIKQASESRTVELI